MNLKSILKKIYKKLNINYRRLRRSVFIFFEKIDVLKNRKKLKNIVLTEEQKKSIDEIWKKNYGKKILKDWHKLYTSYTGNFDKYYFPETFFRHNLIGKLNPYKRRGYLSDKILTLQLFKDIQDDNFKMIKTYAYNCNGYFYDESRNYKIQRSIRKN